MTLQLLVAGHTNTGKTSMLRTLGRRHEFGEVSALSGTTRTIEQMRLLDSQSLSIDIYDSPGFESAPELRDVLNPKIFNRRDQSEALSEALQDTEIQQQYGFEVLVLNTARQCDALLYIIDAREPVLEKYLDEIYLLGLCGKPIICLLNFTQGQHRGHEWRQKLADIGQHLVLAFDAVVYDWQAESLLYSALTNVLPDWQAAIQQLAQARQQENDWRLQGATLALAETLIRLAAAEDIAAKDQPDKLQQQTAKLQQFVREQESACVKQILASYNYDPKLHGTQLHADFANMAWQRDPFDAETLKQQGFDVVKTSAGGAGIGITIDLMTAGMTLGMPTLIGILAGGLLGARRMLRNLYLDKVRHATLIALADEIILLIASRNLALIKHLEHRGHGRMTTLDSEHGQTLAFGGKINKPLLKARDYPAWAGYQSNQQLSSYLTMLSQSSVSQLIWQKLRKIVIESIAENEEARDQAVNELQKIVIAEIEKSPAEKV